MDKVSLWRAETRLESEIDCCLTAVDEHTLLKAEGRAELDFGCWTCSVEVDVLSLCKAESRLELYIGSCSSSSTTGTRNL